MIKSCQQLECCRIGSMSDVRAPGTSHVGISQACAQACASHILSAFNQPSSTLVVACTLRPCTDSEALELSACPVQSSVISLLSVVLRTAEDHLPCHIHPVGLRCLKLMGHLTCHAQLLGKLFRQLACTRLSSRACHANHCVLRQLTCFRALTCHTKLCAEPMK